jgi:hypothetical protein
MTLPTEELQRSVAFLLNLFDPMFVLPFEIIPGFILRRPTENERCFISEMSMNSRVAGESLAGPYQYRLTFNKGFGMSQERDPSKWRYYVIEFPSIEDRPLVTSSRSRKMPTFELAALISDAKFQWAVTGWADCNPAHGMAKSYSPEFLHVYQSYLHQRLMRYRTVPALNQSDCEDVRRVYERLSALGDAHSFILRACKLYRDSHHMSVHSPFRVLALFTATEFLVTHKPNPSETGDSLTRQIRTKLPLLNRRFDEPYGPEATFPDVGAKGWELLYAYRSAIAHGMHADFKLPQKKGGFAELQNAQSVFFFMDEFVRRLMRHALHEPDLCCDLKQC